MAMKAAKKRASQERRKKHIRKTVHGTADRPRLVVCRSLKHISAALVDDERGVTLTGVMDSSLKDGEFQPSSKSESKEPLMSRKVFSAFRVGLAIAAAAKERGIEKVVFDRNGLRYHGRVRAVAEGARKGGLEF